MKKWIFVLTAAVILLAFGGCRSSDTANKAPVCGVWAVEGDTANIDLNDFYKADAKKLILTVHEDGSYTVDNTGAFSNVELNLVSGDAAGTVYHFTAALTVDSSVQTVRLFPVYRKADGSYYADNEGAGVGAEGDPTLTVPNPIRTSEHSLGDIAITVHTKAEK